MINPFTRGAVLVILAASFWGMSGIFTKIILDNSNGTSISLAFWRDTAGCLSLILYGMLTGSKQFKIDIKDLPWLAAMGAFLGLFHIFYTQSILMNGAAVTTVMQAAMPAVVVLAAFYLFKEPITKAKAGTILIIFIGTTMASGINLFSVEYKDFSSFTVGMIVPVFYTGWTLCGKNMVSKYGATTCLSVAFGVAALMMLPLQPFFSQPYPLNSVMLSAFFGLILMSTFSAFSLYLSGLKYIQAGTASILVMSEILFAAIYAWFFLEEKLSVIQVSGTCLVVAGVIWLSVKSGNQ